MTVSLTSRAADAESFEQLLDGLVADRVASRIAAQDATLWGPDAEYEATKRLSWVGLPTGSRALVPKILELRETLHENGLNHVVLCGMGGSSLAPEVICAASGVPLTVLDSSDPDYVADALGDRLAHTIVVVASKSGSTVETDSQRRAYEKALTDAGLDPTQHLVIVTDPGSPLDASARAAGYRVINADPRVGGRFSALTAFGLVPSGLAGVDIAGLLDDAASAAPEFEIDSPDNPGLRLGAWLGAAERAGVDKLVLAENGSGIPGFGDWAEQLIAESTGKDGKGILPVVVPSLEAPNASPSTPDELVLALGGALPEALSGWSAALTAPLGAAFVLWEYATAVAGRIIGINPFDQPDVESAKQAARDSLEGAGATPSPAFVADGVEVYASGLEVGHQTLSAALDALLSALDADHGYLAVMAYLDRIDHADFAGVRETLAARTGRPTTFGWGPRFLHSTGQYHKGGAPAGVFLQITATPDVDLEIPGRPFTFGQFIHAQAIGDGAVLASHGRPVLRLHLTDQHTGLKTLRSLLA